MYNGRTPSVLKKAPALIGFTMLAAFDVASAAGTTSIFNYVNFAGSPSAINIGGGTATVFNGNVIDMTNGISHQGGAAMYRQVQDIRAFTTTFTFVLQGTAGYGFVFTIQDSTAATNPGHFGVNGSGSSANGLGYGAGGGADQPALDNSIGLVFNTVGFNQASWFVSPGPISTVGLYVDGGPALGANGPANGFASVNDLHNLGFNVGSGNPIQATITYDGTILTLVLTDTVTAATTRQSWPVNIPAIVGANTAFVGFTSNTPIDSGVKNSLNSWSWSQGINTRLATPTFSVAPGQYASTQPVSLSGPAGAAIYYTTNGKPPTTASTRYEGTPISVSSSELIQAVAVSAGSTDSFVAQGNYQIQASNAPIINFPGGFANANGLIQAVGNATVGGNIALTDTKNVFEAAAAWYAAPLNIQTFNTTFTLNPTAVSGNGMAFVLQNYPQTTTGTNLNWSLGNGPYGVVTVSGGPWTLSSAGSNLGYTDIFSSIAVIFDCSSGSGNLTGLYTNGAVPTGSSIDMTSSGVSLHSGHPLSVNLSYSGSTLVETVTDTVTSAKFTHSYNTNIPSIVGGNNAYAGFTASTGYFGANLTVTSWTYSTSQAQTAAVPAAPTNLVVK